MTSGVAYPHHVHPPDDAAAAPVDSKRRPRARTARWFVGVLLFFCLFFERFGVPFGAEKLNLVGVIGLALAAWGVLTGALAFDRARLVLFTLMLFFVAVGQMHTYLGMVPYNAQVSIPSIVQFLGITSFVVFIFAEPMDESEFFGIVNRALLVIACAGIIQFFVQFAGVQIFKFGEFLPAAILAESGWNLQISFGIGNLFKSNGFFLVEPSVMSQFMAIAIIIEMLFFRRPLHLTLFGVAFVLAFSGTGGLVLFGFVVAVAARLGLRGLMIAALFLLFGAVVVGAALVIAPDIGDLVRARMSEVWTPGTSGFARFVTPFWLLSDVLSNYPSTSFFGIGGGTSERLTMPYDYDVNTPIKIGLEYGFPVLVTYVALFLVARRTRRQSVLVAPAIILLMLTGGYQQFGPVVYLMALLICTASLKTAAGAEPPAIGI